MIIIIYIYLYAPDLMHIPSDQRGCCSVQVQRGCSRWTFERQLSAWMGAEQGVA